MVSVTVVAPLPAGRPVGEKVAVAPEGNPVTEKLIALGNIVPELGARLKV